MTRLVVLELRSRVRVCQSGAAVYENAINVGIVRKSDREIWPRMLPDLEDHIGDMINLMNADQLMINFGSG